MAAGRFIVGPYFPARNRDGALVGGALLYVYENGTTTKSTIYSDESLSTLSPNPAVANSSGQFPPVWAEAGTADDPTPFTVMVTGPDGESLGNPSTFTDFYPSLNWTNSEISLAEAAATAAEGFADDAEVAAALSVEALADIITIAAGSPESPSIANKANLNGGNVTGANAVAFREAIGAASETDIESVQEAVQTLQESQDAGYVGYVTWAELQANTSQDDGAVGTVFGPDAGTHTDPVVGGTVDNEGAYRYSTSPAGWQRVGDTQSVQAEYWASEAAASAASIGTTLIDSNMAEALVYEQPNIVPLAINAGTGSPWTLTSCLAAWNSASGVPAWEFTASSSGAAAVAYVDIPVSLLGGATTFSVSAIALYLNAATVSGSSFAALDIRQRSAAGADIVNTTINLVEGTTDGGFSTPQRAASSAIAVNGSTATIRIRLTFRDVSGVRVLRIRDFLLAPGPNTYYRPPPPVVEPQGFVAGANDQVAYLTGLVSTLLTSVAYSAVSVPAGLAWNFTAYPFRVVNAGSGYSIAFNYRGLIDPRVWSGPAYHVDVATGSDNNAGLGDYDGDFAQATKSISQAVRLGNASAAPYRIIVKAGLYDAVYGICASTAIGGAANVRTTQACSIVAYGGRVVHSAHIDETWSADTGTTYKTAQTVGGWVLDLLANDTDGEAGAPLAYATSLANCRATPGTWWFESGQLYVTRGDGAAVTNANTRVLLWLNNATFDATTKDVYIKGFDFRGGRYAALDFADLTTVAARDQVVDDCTVKYAGKPGSEAPAFTIDRTIGCCFIRNSSGSRGSTDVWNFHANGVGSNLTWIMDDCTGSNPGFYSGTSCNAVTPHEGAVGLVVGGTFTGGNGATFHAIQTSKTFVIGASFSGSTQATPEEFKVSNSASAWIADCVISSTARALRADGGTIYKSLTYPNTITGTEVADSGGTITTY